MICGALFSPLYSKWFFSTLSAKRAKSPGSARLPLPLPLVFSAFYFSKICSRLLPHTQTHLTLRMKGVAQRSELARLSVTPYILPVISSTCVTRQPEGVCENVFGVQPQHFTTALFSKSIFGCKVLINFRKRLYKDSLLYVSKYWWKDWKKVLQNSALNQVCKALNFKIEYKIFLEVDSFNLIY